MSTLKLETEPAAVTIAIRDQKLIVDLADGRTSVVPLTWYPRLMHSTQRAAELGLLLGGGYAIEWPDLDEHIGIEGLLAGRKSGESGKSIQRWLRARKPSVNK